MRGLDGQLGRACFVIPPSTIWPPSRVWSPLARFPYTIEDVAPLLRAHADLNPPQRRRDGEVQPDLVVSRQNSADVRVIVKRWMEVAKANILLLHTLTDLGCPTEA